jgi:hypothetical protein
MKIQESRWGEFCLGRVEVRIYKEDLINYIRLRMQTGSKIRLPDNLLDICYEYRKDLLEFGKKFIHDRGRRQDRNSEAAQDYREAATKLVDKYWQQADDPNVD